MTNIHRRVFVKAGGLALVSFGLDPLFLARAAYGARPDRFGTKKTLVCIFQRGAVDGLNMVRWPRRPSSSPPMARAPRSRSTARTSEACPA